MYSTCSLHFVQTWINLQCALLGVTSSEEDKHVLAISTGPDHPASYDLILADAINDFFSGPDWKEKSFVDFHQHIQVQ